MTEPSDPTDPLRAALAGLRRLKARVVELEGARAAPIAVIGTAFRLPGASDADGLWSLLTAGRDALTKVPPERWDPAAFAGTPGAEGVIANDVGGFLDDVLGFDADHFRISPREARALDPQQRLLLEVSWEALERAGRIDDVEGTDTGVFLGVALSDWSQRTLRHPDVRALDVYDGTGSFQSVAAGRLAYALGLRGSAVALDTACSSALVSIHLACQSLRAGETSLALAGGVNLVLSPEPSIVFSRMGALSARGRCATFSADADGYVRSDGVGVVVLKRLDDALRDGDRVLAVIRGSAVNQDGRSNGLTAPNPEAQREVVRAALAAAGVAAADVGFVETHGTGTPLGDPIEVGALRDVYAEGTSPLWLGALKSNVGHTEAAAGVAGFVKLVEVLRRSAVPPNLHASTPSPRLPLGGSRLRLPDQLVATPTLRFGAVSSFGMSGTNAHLVAEAPPDAPVPAARPGAVALLLSGRDDAEVRASAATLSEALARATLADVAHTAAVSRRHGPVRAVVVASDADAARAALGALGVTTQVGRARVALVLGDALDPSRFAAWAAAYPALAATRAGLVAHDAAGEGLADLVALATWLGAVGVEARALSGVGRGALAAAVVAGVLTWDDALATLRSGSPPAGAPRAPARALASARSGQLETARWRDAAAWSGPEARLDEAVSALRGAGTQVLTVGVALPDALALDADAAALVSALAHLWRHGVPVAWRSVQPAALIDLAPTRFRHVTFDLPDPRRAARVDPLTWDWSDAPALLGAATARAWTVVGDSPRARSLRSTLSTGAGQPTTLLCDVSPTVAVAAIAGGPAGAHVAVLADGATAEGAALLALGAVAATELGAGWCGAVDAPPEAPAVDVLARLDGRDVALRGDGPVVRTLARVASSTGAFHTSGAWWVTGGLGAVAREAAAWLVAAGATHLVLSGRAAAGADADAWVAPLRARGVRVDVRALDVTDADAVARLRAELGTELAGVLHLAGVRDDAPISALDAGRVEAVLAAKWRGAEHLDAVTRDPGVVLVVLGSATTRLGVPGQAAYAAANGAVEAVVAARVRAGFPGLCVVSGPWSVGMASGEVGERLIAQGVALLAPEDVLKRMGPALAARRSVLHVLGVDEARWVAAHPGPRVAALLGVSAAPQPSTASVREHVLAAVADALGLPQGTPLDASRGLFDLGLDSMSAVSLGKSLEQRLSRPLPPTLAFDHGTIDALAAFLGGDGPRAPAPARPVAADEPIAVVGLACRFPGGVADPDALWELLVDGVDPVDTVPADRWDADALYAAELATPGRSYVREGAFVEGFEGFDAERFGMSPREATVLDPQQRLLLEVGVEAVERAAIPLDTLRHARVGVYVGIGPSDYARRLAAAGLSLSEPHVGTGNEASFAAGRLAYALGVRGPAIALNTACSSSLVTAHLACQALRAGECDVALSGGVHLMLEPDSTIQLCQLRALSPGGRCRSFDASADGYARGEGAGMVVLKRLADAVRDGDPIVGVIRATGVNHDGPSAGLTVPSGDAQAALLRDTLTRSGLVAADVGLLEAHGTGTRLGDPVELGAVGAVYGERPAEAPLVVSAVKSHLGHLELAAGAAGLAAALLSLERRAFAPVLHLDTVNPAIAGSLPVRFPRAVQPWLSDAPRRAAVSSFGLSGTNAHVVLEQAPECGGLRRDGPVVLRVSAHHPGAVAELARRLCTHLGAHPELALSDVADTLRWGRAHGVWRAAVRVEHHAGALAALDAVARGAHPAQRVSPTAEPPVDEVDAFLRGVPEPAVPAGLVRVALPATPFVRERLWVERASPDAVLPGGGLAQALRWGPVAPSAPLPRALTVVGDDATTDALAEALRARGVDVSRSDELGATDAVVIVGASEDPRALRPLQRALAAVQAAIAGRGRVWLVTQGVSVGRDVGAAGVPGLVRVAALEHPEHVAGWVDLVGATPAAWVDAWATGRTQVRVRAGRLEAPHLEPVDDATPLRTHGTWWVTGGVGEVGQHLGALLLSRGARRVVLTSRRDARVLGEGGAEVRPVDVTDAEAVARMVDLLREDLVGVVHAAGAVDDARIDGLSWARFASARSAKVDGAWNLHDALRGVGLEHFALIGSAAGVLGWRGQAGYASANSALTALALHRRSVGLPATVVAFGPWQGGLATPDVRAAMARAGMEALAPDVAAGAFARALASDASELLVAALDVRAWASALPVAAAAVGMDAPPSPAVATVDTRSPWEAEALVREVVARALGRADPGALDATRGLFDLGLDSLSALEVARALATRTGLPVSDTVAFDHPSIGALVRWLASAAPVASTPVHAHTDEPIAIVGMACRFPGAADPDALWALLSEGRVAITRVPPDRWDADAWFDPTPGAPGRTYVRDGGFLEDVWSFEPAAFGMSPREARQLDPQQRLLLECAVEALERAGVAPDRLRDRSVAVFVGIGGHDHERVLERAGIAADDEAYVGTGNDPAFAAGRIAYVLGTRGPTLSLNTACSSSLVATDLGVRALRDGACELALVGGVRLMLSPEETVRLSALRALSPTARCRPFDADADGYVRGEGCGVVALARLSDARRLRLPVLAVIDATGVNHDGASSGLTVPSGDAQRALLTAVRDAAGVRADEVDAIEAHGTGTSLGDPIELGALGAAYGARKAPLRVGSVKANLGHLELAAGVAGLMRAVLSLQHDALPATPTFRSWSPRAPRAFPVEVPTRSVPWPRDHRRRIGVSAFGLSGTNAHVLVSDPPDVPAAVAASTRRHQPLVVSATTAEAADRALVDVIAFLGAHRDVPVADVAATLLRGRAVRPHRRVLITDGHAVDAGAAWSGHLPRGAARAPLALVFSSTGRAPRARLAALVAAFPVVRAVLERCEAAAGSIAGVGPDDVAAYALHVAVAELWRAAGVSPAVVVGDELGVVAAATCAGVWSVEDGLRVAAARAQVRAGVSGAVDALRALVASVARSAPSVPVVSALTGSAETARLCEPDVWTHPGTAVVDLAALARDAGAQVFVDVGAVVDDGDPVVHVLREAARLHAEALDVGWDALVDVDRPVVVLPTTPWSRTLLRVGGAPAPAAIPHAAAAPTSDVARAVSEEVARALGVAGPVDPGVGLFDLGLDSVQAVVVSERLSARLARHVPTSVLFEHPTLARLVAHLGGEVTPVRGAARPGRVDEPIAIVGMACRFPGAPDLASFWSLLVEGRDAVGEVPAGRWPHFDRWFDPTPGTPGRTYTRAGAFLDDITGFDPVAFRMSPREAEALDPQQRLMLEVSWEALEHAGLPPAGLAETRTGVYVGMGASEYDQRFARPSGGPADAYAGTGNDTSFAAGRIGYLLGVHGPALTVNTACSAALVALHLAGQALRLGECDVALAGAVNLMVAPESHVRLAALRALSPTGRCRSFDADADGYVRGEGAGALVVMRLSDARARGLPVLAVVRATGVNHDGAASALTVPSGPAQTALLRDVWSRAGIVPDDLGFVESHGTGTRLGDPIEARALAAALGDRTRPLRVGAVKTNVGHLELAAGSAGLIKTVLALQHGVVPPNLHLRSRNPDVPAVVELPTRAVPWEGPRVAGVSSFGLSGTNAHVVLEAGDPVRPPSAAPADDVVVPLVAPTVEALEALGAAVSAVLPALGLADVAVSAMHRAVGTQRVAVVGRDARAVADALAGRTRDGRIAGVAGAPGQLWLFPGQEALAPIGDLLAASPAAAAVVARLDAALSGELGVSVREAVASGAGTSRADVAAATLVASQLAIAGALRAARLAPSVVLGVGVGEVSAAAVSGVWDDVAAVRFAAARARALDATPEGRMVAVRASEAAVRAAIGGRPDVSVAAVNGAEAVVLSGVPASVAAVLAVLGDVGSTELPERRAHHASLIDGALAHIREAAQAAGPRRAALSLAVGRLGRVEDEGLSTPDAWAASARETVRLADALAAAAADVGAVVEIAPRSQLLGVVRRAIEPRGRWIGSAWRSDRGWTSFVEAVASLWCRGADVDWTELVDRAGGSRVALPAAPFVRRRLWVDDAAP